MALKSSTPVLCTNCDLVEYGMYNSFPNGIIEASRSNGFCNNSGGGCISVGACGVVANVAIFSQSSNLTFYGNFAGRGCQALLPNAVLNFGLVHAVGVSCDGQLHTALDSLNGLVPLELNWYQTMSQCTTNATPFLTSQFKVRCNLCG